jgi:HlyD family secretion protein
MKKGCLYPAIGLLVVLTGFLIWYFANQNSGEDKEITFQKPEITDVVKKAVATGAVKPRKEVLIKPQVSGVIEELFVEAGSIVKKGQKIARIKLVPSETSVNNAQSSVELARIRLNEAQRELKRQESVFDNKLDIESARAAFENAKQEEARSKQLLEDGVISEQSYKRDLLTLEQRKTEYENAKLISNNAIRAAKTEVEIRQQELQFAINNLQLLREGAASNSRQVANIVNSTVDGMVLDIPVEEGTSVIERNNFNEGTTIAAVADMNSLIFEGMVDESDVGKIKEGMPLELTVGAIQNKKFEATLEYISPKGVEEEGSVKFEIRAAIKPDSTYFLRAGYSASGDVILDRKSKVIAMKERDVIFEKDSTYIEIKNGSEEVKKIPVKLGLSDGIQVEILEGADTTTEVKIQQKI